MIHFRRMPAILSPALILALFAGVNVVAQEDKWHEAQKKREERWREAEDRREYRKDQLEYRKERLKDLRENGRHRYDQDYDVDDYYDDYSEYHPDRYVTAPQFGGTIVTSSRSSSTSRPGLVRQRHRTSVINI